ncbi:unnamed protein product [Rangifer tarandus platyrhynchus]|uniref:Uncharacterized protein n=1 Tax=Rangifer tarandus platyrhynchus TaxID=3082113 RepID=A0AC59ZND8_RANTA
MPVVEKLERLYLLAWDSQQVKGSQVGQTGAIKPRGLLQNMSRDFPDVHREKSFRDPSSIKAPPDFLVIKRSWRLLQCKRINLRVVRIFPNDSVIRFSYEVTS